MIKIIKEQIHANFAEKSFFLNQINSNCRHLRAFPCRFFCQMKSSVGSGWIRIQSGQRIRIQKGKNDPQKWKKVKNFHVLNGWG
jgi:hypothetical protein